MMMLQMRWKTLFFYSLCAIVTSLLCRVAVDANEEMKSNQKDINTNFMKVNEKIDFLSEKIEHLELNYSSTGNQAVSQMMNAIAELNKNSKEILKMKELLLELIDTVNEQKMRKRETKSDVIDKMTSQCSSFCQAKINTWANETSDKFTEDLERLDFDIKNSPFKTKVNACEPNPCSNGGQCELSSYQCTKCPYLTSGTHCENLKCNAESKCFQLKSTLYVVFEENLSWDDALSKCRSEGMRLAMPKDASTTEGVVGQLKTMYEPTKYNHFWIGLKGNGSKEFRWADGTPLGDYSGGRRDFTGRLGWTVLYLHEAEQKVYWYNFQDAELYKHIHYTLCEKRVFMRF